MYRTVTRQIEVKAIPKFLPDRSSPENGYFFWAYTISLTNLGRETSSSRRGTGASPMRRPAAGGAAARASSASSRSSSRARIFEYTSGVPLPTPSGFMIGSYGMVTEAGEPFDIEIPAFSLDLPQDRADASIRAQLTAGSATSAGSNT